MIVRKETLQEARDPSLCEGRLGLLTNQVCFRPETGRYLFQEWKNLKRLFVPEHGLFSELQDQVGLDDTRVYSFLPGIEVVSLYGTDAKTLEPAAEHLTDLDALIIDLQDVGARYYTFATTAAYLLRALKKHRPGIELFVMDRKNPAGPGIEGSPLPAAYESFVGFPGLPHRHGLRLAELILFYQHRIEHEFRCSIFAAGQTFIPPSPNFPSIETAQVYSGQCLLEATNLSEGRGTTRPFEFFGAPFLRPFEHSFPGAPASALRPLLFQPSFHKFKDEICQGFQIIPFSGQYHSLLHSLQMIRFVRENYPEFAWRQGPYEFVSERPAIEILVGDELLLSFLAGRVALAEVQSYLESTQNAWRNESRRYKITSLS
ncbi:MAG: DUF1343 domain-containing protein [Spirochaetales bacterium]|nr:DUF1343 domain-containing protein [Spirochaetales bacterium]